MAYLRSDQLLLYVFAPGRRYTYFNTYSSEIFLYKPWRPKDFIQFEIVINVLVSSFRFIWIPMLWVYDH